MISLLGCAQQNQTYENKQLQSNEQVVSEIEQNKVEVQEPSKKLKTTTKTPSELMLKLSDLAEGYTTKESTPRLKSDVSEEGISWGWKDGYYVRYAKVNDDAFDLTVIKHWVSIYPIENVGKSLEQDPESNENVTYEALPAPNFGDKSKAWRVTYTDEFGDSNRYYEIEFIRYDVYERIGMSGTTTDFEYLKTLTEIASAKIK